MEVTQLQQVGSDWRHRRIGQVDSYLSLDVIGRYNDVGSWTLKLKNGTPQAALFTPGTGVVVWGEDMPRPLLSGPVRAVQRPWSDEDTGPGSIEISGADWNQLLAEKICLPSPERGLSQPGPDGFGGNRQPAAYYGNGVAYSLERALYELVYLNVGPGAWAPRQVRGVAIPEPAAWPKPGTAPLTTFKLRFDNLLEALKARTNVDLAGNPVFKGFRMAWNPSTEKIGFEVYTPSTSARTRFSAEIGNIKSYTYTLNAPKATVVWAGLDQEDDLKPQTQNLWYADRSSGLLNAPWSMLAEVFTEHSDLQLFKRDADGKIIIDDGTHKPITQTDLINSAINQDFVDNGPTGSLAVEPIDTIGSRFGIDYGLGDVVTVAVDGTEITNILREVHVSDTSDGPVITPTIGDPDATESPALYKDVKRLWDSVRRLQRKQVRK